MKNKILLLIIGIFILSFQSCEMAELVYDIDKTDSISSLSVKPILELVGDPIMQLEANVGVYKEEGVTVTAGKDEKDISYKIIDGAVDDKTEGYYVVTYQAINKYGWETIAYRAVLVHDGSPYGDDIAGNYKKGSLFSTSISKYPVDGYWQIDNVFQEEGTSMPIIFADKGDGTYGIVPGRHKTKGFYKGVGTLKNNFGDINIEFVINFKSPDGISVKKTFEWKKI